METYTPQPLTHLHQSQPLISYNPPGIDPNHHNQHPPYDVYHQNIINTLFISGLPDDVKPREIHNLFRRRYGFDFCQLKYTGRATQVVAFATFFSHQAAIAALNSLNGATFDPQTGAILHVELARSNSRQKRLRGAEAYYVIDKRAKLVGGVQETSSDDGEEGPDEPSRTSKPSSSNRSEFATMESAGKTVDHNDAGVKGNEQFDKGVVGDRLPCSTLFIANLGPNCNEEELKASLSQYPGFHIVKMRTNRGLPVAFADFEEVGQATAAMEGLQGSELASSDRGGMHLEYARSKMRRT
ncbi:hypothetical protein ACHQM5_029761 [Ranunculus cassubicifolius]